MAIITLSVPSLAGPRLPLPSKETYAETTKTLKSSDLAAVDAAVAQIHAWIDGQRVAPELWHDWLPSLMAKHRYQDVVDLSLPGMLMRPEPRFFGGIVIRAQAFNALNKPADALLAAKSFYNACPMKKTTAAIDLVELCLNKAHPDDPDIGRRFRTQQILSAGGDSADSAASQPPPPAPSILKSITIDPAPFADALAFWKDKAGGGKFNDQASYANVLLLADQPADAEKIFRDLFRLAISQEELDAATEGIARSLRAEDGSVGRANTWLLSLQKSADKPTPPTPDPAP